MATSVVAKGKVQLMAKEGRTTIPGWLDAEGATPGRSTPSSAGDDAPRRRPMATVAVMVEILSAMLSGADYGPHLGNMYTQFDRPQNVGHFFGALDVSGFLPPEAFRASIEGLVEELRAVPRRDDCAEILLPGEIEARCEARYRAEGIPIEAPVLDEICRLAERFGVAPPRPIA